MWLTDPPFEPDWEALVNGETVVTYEPTDRDEVLLRNGKDFVGTMEFAGHSLGMALCYASAANQKYNIFWHAVASGFLWLNIASDRLRDYFLMARFEQDNDGYSKSYRKKNRTGRVPYPAPFEEALESAPADKREILSKIVPLAKELQAYRRDRDVVVHEVASEAAKVSISALKEQREMARTGKTIQFSTFNYEEVEEAIAAEAADTTVASGIERMKSWYARLVKTSSLFFEFEYWSRKRRQLETRHRLFSAGPEGG